MCPKIYRPKLLTLFTFIFLAGVYIDTSLLFARICPSFLKYHLYLPLPKNTKYDIMFYWLKNKKISGKDFNYLMEGRHFFTLIDKDRKNRKIGPIVSNSTDYWGITFVDDSMRYELNGWKNFVPDKIAEVNILNSCRIYIVKSGEYKSCENIYVKEFYSMDKHPHFEN